jgi:hypothetical protein
MESRLHRIATHEAGHAVAATVLRLPVRYAAVFADGRGEVAYYPVPVGPARTLCGWAGAATGRSLVNERY